MLGFDTKESLEVNDEGAKGFRYSPYFVVETVRIVSVFLNKECSHCCSYLLEIGLGGILPHH